MLACAFHIIRYASEIIKQKCSVWKAFKYVNVEFERSWNMQSNHEMLIPNVQEMWLKTVLSHRRMRLPKSCGFFNNLILFKVKVDYKTTKKFLLCLAENTYLINANFGLKDVWVGTLVARYPHSSQKIRSAPKISVPSIANTKYMIFLHAAMCFFHSTPPNPDCLLMLCLSVARAISIDPIALKPWILNLTWVRFRRSLPESVKPS